MIKPSLFEAFHFFHSNTEYVVGRHANNCLALARTERWATQQGYTYIEEPDPDVDISWMTSYEKRQFDEGVLESIGVIMLDTAGNRVADLWGIIGADDDRKRVIKAEMALEIMKCLITQYETIPSAFRVATADSNY